VNNDVVHLIQTEYVQIPGYEYCKRVHCWSNYVANE